MGCIDVLKKVNVDEIERLPISECGWEIAVHEAGHAVAAHFFAGGSDRALIYEDGSGYQKPHPRNFDTIFRMCEADLSSVWAFEKRWDYAVLAMSGIAAEMLFGIHGEGPFDSSDFNSVADYYQDVCCAWGDDDDDEYNDNDQEKLHFDLPDIKKPFCFLGRPGQFISFTPAGRRLKRFVPHRKKFHNKLYEGEALGDAFRFLEDKKHLIEAVALSLLEALRAETLVDSEGEAQGEVGAEKLEALIGAEPDELTDIASAASALGITQKEIRWRIESGELRSVDFGEIKRVFRSEIESLCR